MKYCKTLTQAYQLQDLTFAAITSLAEENKGPDGAFCLKRGEDGQPTDAGAIKSLIAAWEIVADRVRICRGKPLPGSLSYPQVERIKSLKRALGAARANCLDAPAAPEIVVQEVAGTVVEH